MKGEYVILAFTNKQQDKIILSIRKKIKCVIWDLDNTLWKGIIIEDANVNVSSI